MKKLSLLLSVVLFSSAAVFAGDKKEKKAEACKKESSCCAKKAVKEGDKPTEVHGTGTAKTLKTDHKLKQVAAVELQPTPVKAEEPAKR